MNLVDKLLTVDTKELSEKATGEVEIKRLSKLIGEPFMVECSAIDGARYTELSSKAIDEKGKVDFGKSYDTFALLACEGVVNPDLKDKKLQEHFGCVTPKELALKLFQGGDITKVANLITNLSGFSDDSDDEIKNS